MIEEKIKAIRNLIYEDTGLFIVETDNNNEKPGYPFLSYKVTRIDLEDRQAGAIHTEIVDSIDEKFDEDILETMQLDSKFIISFNAYSNSSLESLSKVMQLWDFFKHKGRAELRDNNIVVVNLSNIQDRTIYIVDNYEYRQGFDVELRILHNIEKRIETIETYKVEGEIQQ